MAANKSSNWRESAPFQVYLLRPDNTSLWLPNAMADSLGLVRGQRLTPEQFADRRLQDLLARRRESKEPIFE